MTLNVSFPVELEELLRRHAEEAGVDMATFVQRTVAEQLRSEEEAVPLRRSPDEFMDAIQKIIDKLPGSGGMLDDSRESIYAGRE
jgi:hypothetical protein